MVSLPSLKNIKKELLNQKQTVEKQLTSLSSQDPYSDPDRLSDNAASDADASEESNHERVEAIEKALQQKLSDIDSSIIRLQQGNFGKCLKCRKKIEIERLAIKLTASYCMKCERNIEK